MGFKGMDICVQVVSNFNEFFKNYDRYSFECPPCIAEYLKQLVQKCNRICTKRSTVIKMISKRICIEPEANVAMQVVQTCSKPCNEVAAQSQFY